MCEDYYMWGTPDEVIGKIEKFAKAGMKHFVFDNLWGIVYPLSLILLIFVSSFFLWSLLFPVTAALITIDFRGK